MTFNSLRMLALLCSTGSILVVLGIILTIPAVWQLIFATCLPNPLRHGSFWRDKTSFKRKREIKVGKAGLAMN